MELKPEDLASFVTAQSSWIAEAGTYKISIGASSLDVKQSAEFQLNQNIIVKKYNLFLKQKRVFRFKI
jgi:beta-glucosidase